ncbi:MAG TPA: CHAT domain-containing protein [Blastocatellia bacterium]|jgi:CHAT domain-containing protein/Flp pilus assembly protein TadD|nr:CHAT domain-containing protein [Blastocatellia bacterium]
MAATKKSDLLSSRKPGTVFVSFRGLRLVLLLAAVLSTITYLAVKIICGSTLERGNAALVEAFSARRLIEPRLSGAFKAAPYKPGPDDETDIKKDKLDLANGLIQDVVVTENPYAHLAYGRLLLCKASKGPDALKHLRRAAKDLAGEADPHNDLGACLFERGKTEDAIEEFDLALKINPAMPQALFNRALCYQRLQLTVAARSDLTRLSTIERDPAWLAEINGRLDDLIGSIRQPRSETETIADLNKALDSGDAAAARAIVMSYYDTVQRYVQTLVGDHLNAAVGGDDAKAERVLSRIETLGGMGIEVRKDKSLAATAMYLRSLPSKEKLAELNLVKEYKDASIKFEAKKYAEAQAGFESLRKKFGDRKNYLYELRATHIVARCQHLSNNFSACIKTFIDCLHMSEKREWLHDYSRALVNLGLSYSRRGQDSTALKCYEDCRRLYLEMNDSEAKPLQLIGMAYWHLGDLEQALNNLQSSTNLFLNTSQEPGDLAYNYLNIADIYRLSDKHSLALLFAEEALRISDAASDTNRAAQACSFIALEQANLGQFEASEESFKAAFNYRDNLKATQREYTEPLIYIRAGEAAVLRGDTAKAVEYYSRAEALAANIEGNIIPRINALRGRAEAEETAGQSERAGADLQLAINSIEDYLKGLSERDHRVEFLDASQGVFDQKIALEIDAENHTAQAFDMSEQSRARALVDTLNSNESRTVKPERPESGAVKITGPNSPGPGSSGSNSYPPETLGLAQVQAALPDDLTLLVYSVTNQRVYIFMVSRAGFEVTKSNVTSAKLARLVADYRSDIRTKLPLPELKEKGGELYQLLIPPAARRLPKNVTVCIVPDKSLHFLPFQTLSDPSGRYLIQSNSVTYAPSATVLIRCIQMDRVKAIIGPEQVLAVGNPKFNRDEFPNLVDLKEARTEAEESASCYSNASALIYSRATEVAVREAMRQCNVAHFAVHCIVQEQSPWKAALVLAPSPTGDSRPRPRREINLPYSNLTQWMAKANYLSQLPGFSADIEESEDNPDDGLLSLKEIYNLSLPHMRLVVLSACQSGIGQYYRGEGIVSLIHPFLSARVSTVVASLWPVESEATSNLMIAFHKERSGPGRSGNLRSGDALREAQLQMIEKGDFAHPYYWASFIVVGGNY